jgi:L-alanine-DL-glutamate epimerase-like enolase superfamily enzyme
MIIARIETFPLRIPFKPGTRSAASAWGAKDLPAVDSLLVKVTTDQGLEGWGEAFGFAAVPVTQRVIDELIARGQVREPQAARKRASCGSRRP